jgi:ribonuclease HII
VFRYKKARIHVADVFAKNTRHEYNQNMTARYIIGIDEVGRGPLAGPVAVGMVVMEREKYQTLLGQGIFPAGKDSKKLSPKKRVEYFAKIRELKTDGILNFGIFYESNEVIDKWNIAGAIRIAIKKGLKNLNCNPIETNILLDGGLKAPVEFINQQSIIKGDEKELIIALASIVAKVSRDDKMVKLAEDFPPYGFEKHKGYGTSQHIKALKANGPCSLHRRTFIKHFV